MINISSLYYWIPIATYNNNLWVTVVNKCLLEAIQSLLNCCSAGRGLNYWLIRRLGWTVMLTIIVMTTRLINCLFSLTAMVVKVPWQHHANNSSRTCNIIHCHRAPVWEPLGLMRSKNLKMTAPSDLAIYNIIV